MSERMDFAFGLGEDLWRGAIVKYPLFVEDYLDFGEDLLLSKREVRGDEFKAYCEKRGLIKPAALNHNVWVTGPRILTKLGWMEAIGRVEPELFHNHMRSVTLWRSLIFGKGKK